MGPLYSKQFPHPKHGEDEEHVTRLVTYQRQVSQVPTSTIEAPGRGLRTLPD